MDNSESIISKIFKNKALFEIPIKIKDGNSVFTKIESRLNQYVDVMKTIDCFNERNPKQIIVKIIKSIHEYENGKPAKAFNYIDNLINDKLISFTFYESIFINNSNPPLFRARLGDYYNYSTENMFHIPFDQREKIKPERYSISGFPCLYLGSSIYVCWEELGRPSLNNFHVSRCEIKNDTKILNLAYSMCDVLSLNNATIDEEYKIEWLKKYLYSWPLQCACSVLVESKENRSFQAEYVIPQFVMQAIVSKNILGVAYLSSKGEYSQNSAFPLMVNYAFPAKRNNIDERKFSNILCDIVKITNPINMGLISEMKPDEMSLHSMISNSYRIGNGKLLEDYNRSYQSHISLSQDTNIFYNQTFFSKLEKILISRPAINLS